MIYSENRAHEKEAAHPDKFLGVSSFLFCSVIGGVERGESARSGADDRSV